MTDENPLVRAVWIDGGANSVQSANSGYEFWFFDPNGGFNFRKFRAHNQGDNFGNVGAARACQMSIRPEYGIPEHTVLNVRVRGRVNGTHLPWGGASVTAGMRYWPHVHLPSSWTSHGTRS